MNAKMMMQIAPLILLIALMYFMLIRPQKKKEKEVTKMRNSLQVGDSIVTIGGICGKVVKIKEESVVIQVGADKVKFEMMKWSVSQVVSSKGPNSPLSRDEDQKPNRPKRLKKSEDEVIDVEPVKATKEDSTKVETVVETEEGIFEEKLEEKNEAK